MPETRATAVDDRLKHLETATEATNLQIQALTAALQQITGEVTKVNGNLQTLTAEMEQIRRNPAPHIPMPNPNPNPNPNHNYNRNPLQNPIPTELLKPLRIVVLRFESGDPLNWIFQIEQFFDLHQTPQEHRLRVASFYFDGAALYWYQWTLCNTQIREWPAFLLALQERFGPPEYEDFQGQLSKLQQTTTVTDYHDHFELLSNRVNGLPESFLLSCFISGLKPEIQTEVSCFAPTTISRALALAKVQENKLRLLRSQPKLHSPYPPLLSTPTSHPIQATTSLNPGQRFPMKKLTQSEMAARREKGLCYNCDEKFVPGHVCKAKIMYLIVPDDETLATQFDNHSIASEYSSLECRPPRISSHAIKGVTVPHTLKLYGSIKDTSLLILVDGGSTNNFIAPAVATSLGLPVTSTPKFHVMVGSGAYLYCQGMCRVPVTIQNIVFLVDFYVLPIEGVELVLGVQWLQQLGPMLFDYNKLTMGFFWGDQFITFKGHTPLQLPSANNLQEPSTSKDSKLIDVNYSSTMHNDKEVSPSSPFTELALAQNVTSMLSSFATFLCYKVLVQHLHCFAREKPKAWTKYLLWPEYWYNTCVHSSTGISPFKAVYGRDLPTVIQYVTGLSLNEVVDTILTTRETNLAYLKLHPERAQVKMKKREDTKQRPEQFQPGDVVLVKLQSYRQQSVAHRSSRKLSPKYFGSFEVLPLLGTVAYKLQLPVQVRIHNVFHVSLLKRVHGTPSSTILRLFGKEALLL